MDFIVPHQVTYDFDGKATVTEVAKALVAQDKLFREAILVLEACFPELDVEKVTVNVREVVQNSPMRHRLEGAVVAVYSPELAKDMPADILDMLFGYNVPDSYDSIVSILILAIGFWGAEKLIAKLKKAKKDGDFKRAEEEEKFLAAERRRLTKIAADRVSVTEEHMAEALNDTLARRQATISKSAMDLLAPAKRHKARSITLPSGTVVGENAIKALPSDVDISQYQPPTDTYPLEGVTLTFRAHDKDRNKHWAATIGEISPDRKPLHLAPDIRADELFTKDSVRADVLVTTVLDAEGDYVPSLYYLAKVHNDDA